MSKSSKARKQALLKQLLKLRDIGRISDLEWSVRAKAILYPRRLHKNRLKQRGPDTYTMKSSRRGWKIVPSPRPHELESDKTVPAVGSSKSVRPYVLLSYNSGSNVRSMVVRPNFYPPEKHQAAKLGSEMDQRIRYVVRCEKCGWQIDGVRRLEKVKRKHAAICETAQVTAAPYMSVDLVLAQGYQGPRHPAKRPPFKRYPGIILGIASTYSGALAAVGPRFRNQLNAPEIYPEDN
jgi:hypothetical protein